MNEPPLPILYSFRRCPYAMRARLAIAAAGIEVQLREVVLRDKPQAMIGASPKATVPVLVMSDGAVIDESREIGSWALSKNDPSRWLDADADECEKLIDHNDGAFKSALDRYKYPNRYPEEGIDVHEQRAVGAETIRSYEERLAQSAWLMGDRATWVDYAVLPFVRQFAHVDKDWFWNQPWPHVLRWLDAFLESGRFADVMRKYPQWKPGDEPVTFGKLESSNP
ncbi:MAG: glutathione S-transferase [Pseudomonadota bacterium]